MNSKTVCQGQSFLDKVIELTGSIDNAFEMALLNKVSITDILEIGTEILPVPITQKKVVALFDLENRPATLYVNYSSEVFEIPSGEFPISF